MMDSHDRPSAADSPGTVGEQILQERYGTQQRAAKFYREQVLDVLTPQMVEFLHRQQMMILSTADLNGHPEASVRFGEPGFITVLDEKTLAWPELRGNGVHTSLGNLTINPRAHLMFLDPLERIGLHLRGQATILEPEQMRDRHPKVHYPTPMGRLPDRWVVLRLQTSYVHCRKHFPRTDAPIDWGTDDPRAKGGDYFAAKHTPSPWAPATHTLTPPIDT